MSTQTLDAETHDAPAPPAVSWVPTRKWIAGVVTALAAVLVNWITAGGMTKAIGIQLVGVVATAVVAYLVPNDPTPKARE